METLTLLLAVLAAATSLFMLTRQMKHNKYTTIDIRGIENALEHAFYVLDEIILQNKKNKAPAKKAVAKKAPAKKAAKKVAPRKR